MAFNFASVPGVQTGNPFASGSLALPAAPKPATPAIPQTTFGTPIQRGLGGGIVSPLLSSLSANTQPFSPSTVGTFNTSPAVPNVPSLASPQMVSSIQPTSPNLTTLQQAAPQNNAGASLSSPYVTTPSGATVDPNTGALISAPIGAYNGQGSSPTVPQSTYGGSTAGLLGYGSTVPTATSAAASGLLGVGATNPATSGAALPAYNTAVTNLANFETGLQTELGNTGSQPIPMPFIQGQQQVENTENAGILSALQGAVQQQQTAIGLGVQGANAQTSALSAAGTQGTTAQQTEQNALQAAGSLTQPVAGATFFGTPETGGMVGTGSQNMASAVALQAEKLQNGTTDPGSAIAALSAYGQPGVNALQQALGPNFNLNTATGSASAQQSNTELSGTATPEAANTVYQQAYGQYQTLQQAVSNVSDFGSTLTAGMTGANGQTINPTDSTYANMTIAQFKNQLSVPQQAQFNSTLAALTSKVSGMLSIGGSETPTQLTTDANAIINGSAPMGTLQATLDRIQTEGNIMLQNQAEVVNNAKSSITPPSNLGTSGSSTGTASGVPSGWSW